MLLIFLICIIAFHKLAYSDSNFTGDSLSNEANQLLNKGLNALPVNTSMSKFYISQAIDKAEKNNNIKIARDAYLAMSKCYSSEEKYDSALFYRKLFLEFHDSLYQISRNKYIDYYTKLYSDSVDYYKKEVLKTEKEINKTREQQLRATFTGIISGILLIIILISYLFFRKFEKKRINDKLKQKNKVISKQREEILLQYEDLNTLSKEIGSQNEILLSQKKSIADNSKMLSGIHEKSEKQNETMRQNLIFAKQIQKSLMPPKEFLSSIFDESFILYKPIELIGGDFYWFYKTKDYFYIILSDCKGHDIPGTYTSIFTKTLLDKIIIDAGYLNPSDILSNLHIETINIFGNNDHDNSFDETSHNGMDIAICRFTKKFDQLVFAGTGSPLYVFSNNKLTDIKGDKFSIGSYLLTNKNNENFEFTNNYVELNHSFVCYLFSDGYYNQMNPNKQKLGLNTFRELLFEINSKPLAEQKDILKNYLLKYKSDQDQTDDISVIGLKTESPGI